MNNGKDKYNNIRIPEELNNMVNQAITENKTRRTKIVSAVATVAALCIFTLSLNFSETFAENISQIPVIKNIASVLTVRSYDFEKENITANVSIPSVDIENDQLENFINTTIEEETIKVLAEAEIRVEEYKEAFIETGGSEEEFAGKNMNVTVGHDIYLQNDNYLSFRVYTHETLAAVYAENLYFNIDLVSQKTLTLEDILGENFVQIITDVVKADIATNPDQYFDEVKEANWQAREDVDFYLNENEELIVVFMKYELAAGAMGRLEFNIPK